jgi:hypothetical protein
MPCLSALPLRGGLRYAERALPILLALIRQRLGCTSPNSMEGRMTSPTHCNPPLLPQT